jgi:molecular chaperone GrpE
MKEHEEKIDAPEEEIVDDMDFEPEDELGSIGAAQAKLKKLRAELKEAQQKRDEYLAGWQREKADAVNLKRELANDAIRMSARIKEALIEDLLPALDSFDMAYGSPTWESVDATWRGGIDGIRNQLLDMLSKNGIERFGKTGEMLNHHLHEAVQEVDDAPGASGSIVRVLRYGYRAGDRVIRPAQVIVKS